MNDLGNPDWEKTVITPSGGFHIYMEIPQEYLDRKIKNELVDIYPDVEFKTTRIMIAGTVIKNLDGSIYGEYTFGNSFEMVEFNKAPAKLMDLICEAPIKPKTIKKKVVPVETIKKALESIDNETEQSWVNVGMALKNHFSDKDEEGFALWSEWSSTAPEASTEQQLKSKWAAFKTGEGCLTISYILKEGGLTVNTQKQDNINSEQTYKDWVYLSGQNRCYNVKTKETLIDVAFGRHIISLNDNSLPDTLPASKISDYLIKSKLLPVVYSNEFNPSEPLFFQTTNGKFVNLFNRDSLPKKAEEYTPEGLHAIGLLKNHIKFIFGADDRCSLFTNWLAFVIQFPGVKAGWCPLIQSEEAMGKTFFGTLLKKCLGGDNVKDMSPEMLQSEFTEWCSGRCINVLEELKMSGANRYVAYNKLKPYITNPDVNWNEKGIAKRVVKNVVNYIAFTNYKDAIPASDGDRRYGMFFVECESKEKFKEYTGVAHEEYFRNLYSAMNNYCDQILKWLSELELSDKDQRDITGNAPRTAEKDSVILTEKSSIEGLYEISELLEEGGELYNKEMFSSVALFAALSLHHTNLAATLTPTAKNTILKRLNYTQYPSRVKFKNVKHQIWVKNPNTSLEKIKNILG